MLEGISANLCWFSLLELDPARKKVWVSAPLMVLMLTWRGSGRLVVQSAGEYPIDEGENSLFLMTPQMKRHVLSDAENPLAVLALGITVEFADGTDFFDRCRPATVPVCGESRTVLSDMLRKLYAKQPAGNRRTEIEMQCGTFQICAEAMKLCPPRPAEELPRRTERCRKAVEFLSGRFSEEPNLEELAERCGMSRTLFFRTFREETGMTPGEFRLRRRIREAQKLLLQGKLTVSEIAATLGWESPFHFSRIFKRETGFSPGDFRKRR